MNSENAIAHLLASVKAMDVKNFDGENIQEVVAQLRGAHKRLKMVTAGGKTASVVPVDFLR